MVTQAGGAECRGVCEGSRGGGRRRRRRRRKRSGCCDRGRSIGDGVEHRSTAVATCSRCEAKSNAKWNRIIVLARLRSTFRPFCCFTLCSNRETSATCRRNHNFGGTSHCTPPNEFKLQYSLPVHFCCEVLSLGLPPMQRRIQRMMMMSCGGRAAGHTHTLSITQ